MGIGGIVDIAKLLTAASHIVDMLRGIAPHAWKGNADGQLHHFDADSIQADAGLLADEKRAWVSFAYTDNGMPHTIRATMKVDQVGKQGGADVIEVDGEAVDGADFVLGYRLGWTFHRVVCEFKYTKDGQAHRIRFDGDL